MGTRLQRGVLLRFLFVRRGLPQRGEHLGRLVELFTTPSVSGFGFSRAGMEPHGCFWDVPFLNAPVADSPKLDLALPGGSQARGAWRPGAGVHSRNRQYASRRIK